MRGLEDPNGVGRVRDDDAAEPDDDTLRHGFDGGRAGVVPPRPTPGRARFDPLWSAHAPVLPPTVRSPPRGAEWADDIDVTTRDPVPPEAHRHDRGRGRQRGRPQATLGLWQLTAIGIGGIIGAGIFTLAGTVAHGVAGPAVLISFLVAGVASAAAALSYAEFAGLIPKAGSAYTYGYAVLGEIVGWFIGWDLLLEYTAIVAVVAIGISGYVGFLVGQFGVDLPAWMLGAPGTGDGHVIDVFAIILCLLTAFVLTRGIRSAARFELVAVGIKVGLVVLIVVLGVFHINSANYQPYFPFGFGGVMTGAATVFFAVFGYDAMSTAAEESVDARKHMPKAILLPSASRWSSTSSRRSCSPACRSTRTSTRPSGFSSAFASVGLGGVANVIAIGAIVGIITVLLTFMLGASRVWFSMSRDGLMPKWFAHTDPKRHVPTRVTWIIGIAAAVLAGLLPISIVAELTNIGILLAFVVVCSAVIVLRYRQPACGTFKLPFMPVIPAIGVIASLWLVTFLQWDVGAVRDLVRDRARGLPRVLAEAQQAGRGGLCERQELTRGCPGGCGQARGELRSIRSRGCWVPMLPVRRSHRSCSAQLAARPSESRTSLIPPETVATPVTARHHDFSVDAASSDACRAATDAERSNRAASPSGVSRKSPCEVRSTSSATKSTRGTTSVCAVSSERAIFLAARERRPCIRR